MPNSLRKESQKPREHERGGEEDVEVPCGGDRV